MHVSFHSIDRLDSRRLDFFRKSLLKPESHILSYGKTMCMQVGTKHSILDFYVVCVS